MYEVCGRDESAFSRLLDRLPRADMYETDAYPVYEWLPRDRHMIGKGGAVNRNERLALQAAEQAEQACEECKGLHKERGNAELSADDSA